MVLFILLDAKIITALWECFTSVGLGKAATDGDLELHYY